MNAESGSAKRRTTNFHVLFHFTMNTNITNIHLSSSALDNLPSLTHLQFAVLNCLLNKPLRGQALRDQLVARGIHKSGPKFYQLMQRLETEGIIQGQYQQKIVENQIHREREYTITDSGPDAITFTEQFYNNASQHKLMPTREYRCVGGE